MSAHRGPKGSSDHATPPTPTRLAIAELRANILARVEPERARQLLMAEGVPWREAGRSVFASRDRWRQMARDIQLRGGVL